MESNSNFSDGMNSDISKVYQAKNTYLQALNFRPVTEVGGSNGSLVNIKGNECKMTFPELQPVYKLILNKGTNVAPLNSDNNITFIINGQTFATPLTINNNTTGFDIYTYIKTNFVECYQNITGGTKTFAIAYEDDYVVFYQQPIYVDCGPTVASIDTTISITYSLATSGPFATLMFVNKGAADSLIQDKVNPYVKGILNNINGDSIVAIGSTFILNDIYILTAPNVNTIPGNDKFATLGTIWKLNINDITKQHTLTLIYSSNLDFTKFHPVPPSAITGRYESVEIKRIYWSDNYNKIRTINTEIPQLMALNPTLLSVIPKSEFTQPILDLIGAGSLASGCYQLAYRLSKVLGSVTNFSELSNPVYLTATAESVPFRDYIGNVGGSGKKIVWKLNDVDMNYEQIETVIIYRSSDTAVPVITSMGLRTVSPTMLIEYSDAGADANLDLTLDEFLLFNGTFTHAKTCDTKDNRLFWGNVRSPRKELESYDARAFRANTDGNILLTNTTIPGTYSTYQDAALLAQTEDTINEYYDNNGEYSARACYLKPDDLTKLGGKGVNISYEFGTHVIQGDKNFSVGSSTNYDLSSLPLSSTTLRETDGEASPIILNYTYPQNSKLSALKQPERTSLLKGFQHEEIYRFGIQFFDKQNNPYFTKWIGDIKMPSYGDTNSNPDPAALAAGITDFRLSYTTDKMHQYLQVLYIKFTVDCKLVEDAIGSYQIVRVKRDGANKTIWGVGMINPMTSAEPNGGGNIAMIPAGWENDRAWFSIPPLNIPTRFRHYKPFPSQESVETLNIINDGPAMGTIASFKMFDCWDMDAGLRPNYTAGDKLLVRSRLISVNYRKTGSDNSYRAFYFNKAKTDNNEDTPKDYEPIDNKSNGPFFTASNADMGPGYPFFILKMKDETGYQYANYTNFLGSNSNDFTISEAIYKPGNEGINDPTLFNGYNIINGGAQYNPNPAPGNTNNPCYGKRTLFLSITGGLWTTTQYGCTADDYDDVRKLLALYYKPNSSIYGGATHVARSNNEYIPCGEYITTIKNNLPVSNNLTNKVLKTFGGDVFTVVYDMMKTVKPDGGEGAEYRVYEWTEVGDTGVMVHLSATPVIREARFSTSFFFPCTVMYNSELRTGNSPNRSLDSDMGYQEDTYDYNTYCNVENDVKTYFPKPLNFQTTDEWINRIYFSEIKFNNETQDSWSNYLTDNFYDVEGNYGGINALISLKDNMYYIQERAVGLLMINPVSMVNDLAGTAIQLGASSEVIQKHYNKAIDVGTSHQWSVYRSQSTITFVDIRHKKIYIFNGESVSPISDTKGQRNFVIKRLHNDLLINDNPVIDKGILTTYDYYHNEFLYTFANGDMRVGGEQDPINDENLTIAYSEMLDKFTGMYSFAPNLYINSNKYLISTNRNNKNYFHNYGTYGTFYGVLYPSTLKVLINDNPKYTKIFDNFSWISESIDDNIQWSDDLNVYPGSIINPLFPDDINIAFDTFDKIRCYNQFQNSDYVNLLITGANKNLRKSEQGFNTFVPRNKFNYDVNLPSVNSLFNPAMLTKTTFGERLRDKWLIVDLSYPNSLNNRFVIHNLNTTYKVSDR